MEGLGCSITGKGGMVQSLIFTNRVATHISGWGDLNFAWSKGICSPDDNSL